MKRKFPDDRVKMFIGDIRDRERVFRACENVDIVIHASALKHIDLIEFNPFEALLTNCVGTQNLIDSCLLRGVKRVIAISSDKAVNPINTYGATKLLMEKLILSANNYKGDKSIFFKVVRFGNLAGSSNSVIPKWIDQIKEKNEITITDGNMTRFHLTMDEAVKLVIDAIENDSYKFPLIVPKLRAYNLDFLAHILLELYGDQETKIKTIGIREGEKLHEDLGGYSSEDAEKLNEKDLIEICS